MCTVCDQIKNDFEKRLAVQEEKLNAMMRRIEENNPGIISTYSPKQAAPFLNRSAYTVSEMCRTGKLKAYRDGKDGPWIIPANSINNYLMSLEKN